MIILLVIGASILFALVRGGKLGNLAFLRFRWAGLILAGFFVQIAIFSNPWQQNSDTRPLTPMAYLASLFSLLIALGINQRVRGMQIIALGFVLNFAAIAFNGGYMPVSEAARALTGQPHLEPGQVMNNVIGAGPETRLTFLGDIFAIPKGLPFPNVFSIGDVLISIGAAYMIYSAICIRPAPP